MSSPCGLAMIYIMPRYVRAPPNLTERARMLPSRRFQSKDLPKKTSLECCPSVFNTNLSAICVHSHMRRCTTKYNVHLRIFAQHPTFATASYFLRTTTLLCRSSPCGSAMIYIMPRYVRAPPNLTERARMLPSRRFQSKDLPKKTNLSAICVHSHMRRCTTKYNVHLRIFAQHPTFATASYFLRTTTLLCRSSPCGSAMIYIMSRYVRAPPNLMERAAYVNIW